MPAVDRRVLLTHIELFRGIPEPAIDELMKLTSTRKLRAREELYHKGDEAAQLYGVLSGRLKVVASGEDGKGAIFVHMGPGEVVGEIALLDGGARSATVVAVEPVELLVLRRRDFLAFLNDHAEVAVQLAQVLAARVRRLSETVEDAFFKNLPARLAKKLLALARSEGSPTPEGTRIDFKLSQSDLAELVGKTREAVNKQLRVWAREGLVSSEGGHFTIHDMDALERATEQDEL